MNGFENLMRNENLEETHEEMIEPKFGPNDSTRIKWHINIA